MWLSISFCDACAAFLLYVRALKLVFPALLVPAAFRKTSLMA